MGRVMVYCDGMKICITNKYNVCVGCWIAHIEQQLIECDYFPVIRGAKMPASVATYGSILAALTWVDNNYPKEHCVFAIRDRNILKNLTATKNIKNTTSCKNEYINEYMLEMQKVVSKKLSLMKNIKLYDANPSSTINNINNINNMVEIYTKMLSPYIKDVFQKTYSYNNYTYALKSSRNFGNLMLEGSHINT